MSPGNLTLLYKMQLTNTIRRIHFNLPVFFLQQLLWPLLHIASVYLSYAPFWDGKGGVPAVSGDLDLWTYLFSGIFVLFLFQEYIGIGMGISTERDFGVLEILYLSPASRLAWLMGLSLSAVISAVISVVSLMASAIILFDISLVHPFLVAGSIMYVILASIPWGAFVSSVFLIGRNARFLYALFETPADFFSGFRFPVSALPAGFAGMALLYPISHSISLIRLALTEQPDYGAMLRSAGVLALLAIAYGILATDLLRFGERRGKERGDLSYS